ncbi:elongation of very long chain fatty acids protein 4-like isoform X1 [Biomphalaria pfeifferi]|uniref:Elongation of very long chain fatty acids protein n=1 Tax=Biomphalaria pfeifferi TaxID=112525 RepID=A0AAD8FM22_BIOPF|nr:elongation of very long chain fatty acids protein 4-like isoform X1 [Biomphalaria pfeifferi]
MEVIQTKLHELNHFYEWAFSVADERVSDWPLMWGYSPTLAITALYLLAVSTLPKFMENRPAFNLKYTLVIYNFICVLINFHICSELLISSTMLGYSYSCQPVSYTYDPYEIRIAKALWWFYFSKCVEMLDTIFFILRKKNNQVSFLHVYHHATMFPIWYIGVKWVAGGQSFFGAMINSFIHVIMYTYYGVAALGPEFQKFLWWKRYLTRLQLLQFFVGLLYASQSIYQECDYPLWMEWAGIIYGISIVALFINFYVQAYIKPSSSSRQGMKSLPKKIQFVTGIAHASQSLILRGCGFPEWMHWALISYAFTILLLFINFYYHAYRSSKRTKSTESNGSVANGHALNGKMTEHAKKKN